MREAWLAAFLMAAVAAPADAEVLRVAEMTSPEIAASTARAPW